MQLNPEVFLEDDLRYDLQPYCKDGTARTCIAYKVYRCVSQLLEEVWEEQ